MSSASVFNPHVLAELRHIRSSTVSSDRVNRNFTPNYSALSAVRRNIFGPVDHDECRNFVEKQLDQQRIQDMEFWGFDFDHEMPIPGHNRFKWEAVPEKPMSRPHKKPLFEPVYDISHLYPEPLEDVRPAKEDTKPATATKSTIQIEKVKQSLITDFLKSKKNGSHRLQQLKKNMSVTPSPNRTGKIAKRRSIKS